MQKPIILAINPGSTSTKIAIYANLENIFVENLKHSSSELSQFPSITDQYDFRKEMILKELAKKNIDLNEIDIVIGRGGLVKPIKAGVYAVNDVMLQHLRTGYGGKHASNLGGIIANSIAKTIGLKEAYIADPVVTDEMSELARVAGHPLFSRRSIFHALNQRAISRIYAKEIGKNYHELNLIVAHMGGGISVGAHLKGRVVDVNQALDGEGPFSPERSGTLPMNQVIEHCFSGKYTETEMRKMVVGEGGYVAYFGVNDAYEIEKRALSGDEKAVLLEEAMAYQIAKAIGENAAVLKGEVDAIILTGGLAYGKPIVEKISKYISWIAPVKVYPGEDEMGALALNATMIYTGELAIEQYEA